MTRRAALLGTKMASYFYTLLPHRDTSSELPFNPSRNQFKEKIMWRLAQTLKGSFVLLICLGICGTLTAEECDYQCTLKKHLTSIQERNFEVFKSTLTTEDSLTFLLPNGKFTKSSSEYVAMLRGWFGQEGWTFDYEVVSSVVGEDLGHTLLLISYDEEDRGGKPYHLDHYLSLLFQRQAGSWRLVHDQNTATDLSKEEPKVDAQAKGDSPKG